MIRAGLVEGFKLHFVSSWVTGLAVVGAMQPFDFAATRLANQQKGSVPKYKGVFNCLATVAREEGVMSIYTGVVPNYLRFGPYCILVFLFLEQLKKVN